MMAEADEKLIEFTLDGRAVQARPGESILRTALAHGIEIPYYCWHPGLSVVASCRLCLVEIDEVDSKTGQLRRLPKLIPSCKEPVREGIAVWTKTEKVKASQRTVMEDLLLNHPLDCPVCDQAGECYLQDFSYRYGSAESRMIDPKTKQMKKDTGEHLLLYADRCILCSRCVRFCREVSGGGELAVINRGDRCEIDLFPGNSLEDNLSGNIADICPVGAFLDKDFLFRERVWYLRPTPSICSGCASGCTVWIDHRGERVGRFRPRCNPAVNDYWMCDEGRYLWKHLYRPDRLLKYQVGQPALTTYGIPVSPKLERSQLGYETRSKNGGREVLRADQVGGILSESLRRIVDESGPGRLAVVVSPMLDCETIYMICKFVRQIDVEAVLVGGPWPRADMDQTFKSGFTISAEKVPNAKGLERILSKFAGPQMQISDLATALADRRFSGVWITGGYFDDTLDRSIVIPAKPSLLVVQDSFAGTLTDMADIVLPMTLWPEREGSFVNSKGLIQPFDRAVLPPMGVVPEGQWLAKMVGIEGIYRADKIRKQLAEFLGGFELYRPPELPELIH
jgi:NADH-quinone oxidoreductase subunit G